MERRTHVFSKEMQAVLRSVFLIAPLLLNYPLISPKRPDSSEFTVTNADDGEPNSLRMLIKNAPSGSTITFSPSLPNTIYITDYIMINKDLVIEGPGADKLAISANGLDSLFAIGSSVNISGLTLAEGTTQTGISGTYGGAIWNSGTLHLENIVFQNNAAPELGGAIYNGKNGKLYIESCTFFHNRTLDSTSAGGALANEGTAVITNSTFYANYAEQNGGAIYNISGNLEIINSTIWGNTVGLAGGGGITIKGGRVSLKNTIVAGNHNQAEDMQDDVVGSFASEGYNLVQFRGASHGYITSDLPDGLDPLLDTSNPLYTPSESDMYIGIKTIPIVIALKLYSPAIDTIPPRFCDTKIDQLNTPRPQGKGCDIGAYEFVPLAF